MKSVLFVSFFTSHNIGDILISDRASELFATHINLRKANFSTYELVDSARLIGMEESTLSRGVIRNLTSKHPFVQELAGFLKLISKPNYSRIKEISDQVDTVIFCGGNMVMDLGCLPILTLAMYKDIKSFIKLGKNIAFCFIGVGPFNNKIQKKYAAKIFSAASFISVRDNPSYLLLKSIAPDINAEVWRDPVLTLDPPSGIQTADGIGINVYFGNDKNTRSRKKKAKAFVKIILRLRTMLPKYTVYLFSSELTDINDIVEVYALLPQQDSKIIKLSIQNAEDLFSLYNNIKVILGTRMHTLITSLICRKPVTSLVWQEKVRGLISYFEMENTMFSLNDIDNHVAEISASIQYCINNEVALKFSIDRKLTEVNKDTARNLENYFAIME